MFKPLPDGAKAVIKYTVNGKEWTNNLWFTKPDYDANDLTVLGQILDTSYAAQVKELLSNQAAYVRVKMYDMRVLDGETLVFATAAGAGTQTGEAMSAAMALCLTLYTADRGRSARGRIYIAGSGTDKFATGAYDSAHAAAHVDLLTDIFEAVAVEGWTPVIASGQHNGVVLTTLAPRPITLVYCRSLLPANQRRRVGRP